MIYPCYIYTVSFESPVLKNNLVSNKYKLHKCTLNCLNWQNKKHIAFNLSLANLQVISSVLFKLSSGGTLYYSAIGEKMLWLVLCFF